MEKVDLTHHENIEAAASDRSNVDENHENPGYILGFETDEDNLPPGYFKSKFFIGTMMAISFGLWASVAAFGYAAPILSIINEDIGPDPRYTWVSLTYSTSLAVCLAPLGRVSDIFGRRYLFIGSGVISIVGSIVCALATSIPMLIGGNVLLGVSSATQLSFNYTMGEIVPIKYRYLGSAFVYLWCYPGSGFGPSIAYSFIENWPSVGWRGVYWLLLAVNSLALSCWVLFYFPPSFTKKHRADVNSSKMYWIRNYDYIGTLLFAAGIVTFIIGLSWGGVVYPWTSPATIAAIVVGAVVLVLFALFEVYAPLKEPLVPKHLFQNWEWVVAVLLMGIGASVYYAFAIVWPMQVSILYGNGNQAWIGIASSALGLILVLGQVAGGVFTHRIGHTRYQVMTVLTCGATFMAAAAASTPYNFSTAIAMIMLGNFFVGWNEVICIANTTICVKDQKDIGVAGGLAGSIRSTVSAVASAVYTTVLTNRLAVTVPAEVPPAVVEAGLPAGSVTEFISALSSGTTDAFQAIPGITDQIIAVGTRAYKEANADAYKTVYLCTLAFTGLAIILSWWSPNTEQYMSGQIAATLHNEEVVDPEKTARVTSG